MHSHRASHYSWLSLTKPDYELVMNQLSYPIYGSLWVKPGDMWFRSGSSNYLVFVLLACSTRTAFQPSRAQLTRQLVTRHLIVKWINYHLRYYSIHKFSNSSSKHLLCLTQSKLQQNVSESRAEYVKILWVVHGLVERVGNPDLFKLLDGVTGEASTLNKLKLIIGESQHFEVPLLIVNGCAHP